MLLAGLTWSKQIPNARESCCFDQTYWWWVKGGQELALKHPGWQHSLYHLRPADAIGSGMLVPSVWSDFRIGARSSWNISLPVMEEEVYHRFGNGPWFLSREQGRERWRQGEKICDR